MPFNNSSKLFQPVKVGNLNLSHRVVLAPLTRARANAAHVPGDMAVEYYAQRASVPGTLLISEGTLLSPKAGNLPHIPRICTQAQIQAWKKIADAVHAKGSFIYMQLWALGRADHLKHVRAENPGLDVVAPSGIPIKGRDHVPRPLTIPEIKVFVEMYRTAAINAIHRAGCDGVELHFANGYLPDQFLQDVSNKRTDQYGGSIGNRCRFPLEVLEAVVQAVGQEKVALRISPWSEYQDMRMADPIPTFSYFISRVRDAYPRLSFLHVIEPRIHGGTDGPEDDDGSNDFLREIWKPRKFISAGGYTRESAMQIADQTGELVAFGRLFISNPDLPLRLEKNIPLAVGDRSTYYAHECPKGYTDYPFAKF